MCTQQQQQQRPGKKTKNTEKIWYEHIENKTTPNKKKITLL